MSNDETEGHDEEDEAEWGNLRSASDEGWQRARSRTAWRAYLIWMQRELAGWLVLVSRLTARRHERELLLRTIIVIITTIVIVIVICY